MWLGIPRVMGHNAELVADGVREGEIDPTFSFIFTTALVYPCYTPLSIQEEIHEMYLSVNFFFTQKPQKWELEERESWRKKQTIHNLPFSIYNLNPYKGLFGSSRRYFLHQRGLQPWARVHHFGDGVQVGFQPLVSLAWPLYNSTWRPWFVAHLFL